MQQTRAITALNCIDSKRRHLWTVLVIAERGKVLTMFRGELLSYWGDNNHNIRDDCWRHLEKRMEESQSRDSPPATWRVETETLRDGHLRIFSWVTSPPCVFSRYFIQKCASPCFNVNKSSLIHILIFVAIFKQNTTNTCIYSFILFHSLFVRDNYTKLSLEFVIHPASLC